MLTKHALPTLALALIGLTACDRHDATPAGAADAGARDEPIQILNVSYDPTRELYEEIDAAFARQYKADTGRSVTVKQSHGGSAKQARSVIDGLEADIVTLGLAYDIDAIAKAGLVSSEWAGRLPNRSTPFASTIVFLVRRGNPRGIHDWDDLVKPGVAVITPNPKTSGGARWNFLSAWGYELAKTGNDAGKAQDFVARLYKNVPVLDSGARGATTTFVERGIGDVLVAWESEALLALRNEGDKLEEVVPSRSIVAATPIAVVDKVVDRRGTRAVAEAYARFLYTDEAQAIAQRLFYRSGLHPESAPHLAQLSLFTIDDVFGGWQKAQAAHFVDGATFDKIYQPAK